MIQFEKKLLGSVPCRYCTGLQGHPRRSEQKNKRFTMCRRKRMCREPKLYQNAVTPLPTKSLVLTAEVRRRCIECWWTVFQDGWIVIMGCWEWTEGGRDSQIGDPHEQRPQGIELHDVLWQKDIDQWLRNLGWVGGWEGRYISYSLETDLWFLNYTKRTYLIF